jgi:hypothetical protein
MRAIRLVLGTLFLVACSSIVSAQDSGSISGTVRDNTGAIIPNASVAISNSAEGIDRKTTTNGDGDYLVAGLPRGDYDVTISSTGFKKFEEKGVVLRVASKVRVDALLSVGEITTAVEVLGGSVAQVETDSSELAGTVTAKQISQLVLNGRNFTQLVTLVPGVSNQTGQDEGTVGVYGSVAMSINGGRTEYNNWEIDGGDNMDNGSNGTLNVYPNVDAIAEVQVLTSSYGAQYGRNGSGTVETVTKSGTSAFHGDVFEFVRNDDFNANNYFTNAAGQGRPEYRKNDYGYTIGGPVYIPKLYNTHKDKTFFFFSEEWRKELVPGQLFDQLVPSAAERSGNFSDVCPGVDCPHMANGSPFPNNQVPVDPNATNIENALIPLPNTTIGGLPAFSAAPATPTDWREELVRVDENFTDNHRFFFRFIHDSWKTITPTALWDGGSFPTVQTNFVGPGTSLVAHMTDSLSPTLLNEFVFSYTADHITLNAIGNVARPSDMTMTGIFDNGFGGLLPAFSICCNAEYGGGFGENPGYFPWTNSNPTYTFREQLTKNTGSHNLYTGFYFAARQKNEENSPQIEGQLNFDSTTGISSGNGFADMLMGNIASFSQTTAKIKYYNRAKGFEPYFQDDWRLAKRFTVNLGLRVSMFGTYHEKYLQAYNFNPADYTASSAEQIDPNSGNLIPGTGNPFDGIVQCGAGGVPASCMKGHLFNPAPRVGFAWDVFGDGKTALRGGYGIFYEQTNGNEGNTESLEGSAPLVLNATQYNINGYTSIGSGSGAATYPPLSPVSIPSSAVWPYMQQWHLDVQRELMHSTVIDVSYVGTKGTHLTLQRDINQLQPTPTSQNPYLPGQAMTANDCNTGLVNGAAPTGQAAINFNVACGGDPDLFRPYQGVSSITSLEEGANSIYNALQVSVKRTVGRLNFSLAYTYSHSLDDSSDRYDSNFVDSYNLGLTRASSNFDQRHLLNISTIYDVPFFRTGMLHKLLGGWQLSGLMTYQSGTPFSIVNGGYGPGVGNGAGTSSFMDIVGNPYNTTGLVSDSSIPGPLLYNPNAYAAPTGLTFGDSGRNSLNNPARTNFDMGLFKQFALTETRRFEFRAEGYNVFNHTQFNGVNNVAPSPTFLYVSGAHNPRILQLGAKFFF